VTDLSTSDACEAVMTAANDKIAACTYTPADSVPVDIQSQLAQLFEMIETPDTGIKCAGNDNSEDNVVCGENLQPIPTGRYTSISGLTDDQKQAICCTAPPPAAAEEPAGSATHPEGGGAAESHDMNSCAVTTCEQPSTPRFNSDENVTFSGLTDIQKQAICCTTPTDTTTPASTPGVPVATSTAATDSSSTCIQPTDDALTGYSLGADPTFSTTGFSIPNLACDTTSGYGTLEDGDGKQIPAKATACSEGGTAYTLEGCYKTGFCRDNNDYKNNVTCWSLFHTDKEFEKGEDGKENIIPGQDFHKCCEYNWWWRVSGMIVIILIFAYKTVSEWDDIDRETHTLWRLVGIVILAAWIFTNIIPYMIYYSRKFLDVEKEKSDIKMSGWDKAFYFFIVVLSVVFPIVYNQYY
jgi:hypothetical protein